MAKMEQAVRTISSEGLLWGVCKFKKFSFYFIMDKNIIDFLCTCNFAAKLVPVGYGIKKLQIGCVVEDDKVSIDWLTEEIQNFEDLVQSVDIAAFNKI
jgi:translation elongation factor EF-1beta